MTIHSRCLGQGPDLVLIHGWGLHGGVFADLAARLAQEWRVTSVDLPGHGQSPALKSAFTLAAAARALGACVPSPAHWLGWSLGGMVALQHAYTAPEHIKKLILVASTPRFIIGEAWPHALDPLVLHDFAHTLNTDYRGTLERFVSLQAQPADPGGRDTLRSLRRQLIEYPAPSPETLRDGLNILQYSDLRAAMAALPCPGLVVLGGRDRLVPPAVGQDILQLSPLMHVRVLEQAGHAPFLSHPDQCVTHINHFLHGIDN